MNLPILLLLHATFFGDVQSAIPQWVLETDRKTPPPPVVDTCANRIADKVFAWASYKGSEIFPRKVQYQRQSLTRILSRIDTGSESGYESKMCSCYPCKGYAEPICKEWVNGTEVKVHPITPFEFSRFPDQPHMTQSVFLAPEGIQSQSSKGEVFYRVQRDAAGRVRKTVSGTDTDPSKEIDLYLPQQDSLGRDTVITRRQSALDSAGKEKRSKDWEREYRSYDSLGRLERYWLETDLSDPPEDLSGESCLETQFLYDARGFNHIQLHRIPRNGEVVAVSSFENNRGGRPVRQKVGYIQNGKVVDWLVGNFWRYDSLGRLTYRVQYTNPKWIRNLNVNLFYLRTNCNWWNRP